MGIIRDAMARAIQAIPGGKAAPVGFQAQIRAIGGRGKDPAQRVAAQFGVTRDTARKWLKGGAPNKANRAKAQRVTDEREERRQRTRAARAAAGGLRVETRARFGYMAPAGTTDDARLRRVAATMSPDLTDQLVAAYNANDEARMQDLIAEGIGRDYFREGGSRASSLDVELSDIDYIEMEF